MPDYYILDQDGNPVVCFDVRQWGEWFGKAERKVDETAIRAGIRVSTVFLGLDHAFGGGRPLIYESLVFGGKLDQEMRRYSTKEEALKGHERLVKEVEAEELTSQAVGKAVNALDPPDVHESWEHARTLAIGETDDQQE
ncbi:MAG: hypothetical protein GY906_24660 [bacterium]|nr:hypothetical protein [bacterium]